MKTIKRKHWQSRQLEQLRPLLAEAAGTAITDDEFTVWIDAATVPGFCHSYGCPCTIVCDHNPGASGVPMSRIHVDHNGGRHYFLIGQCRRCGTVYAHNVGYTNLALLGRIETV